MLAERPVLPWIDGREQLTADAIEAMAAWSFAWSDERNLVMLVDNE